VLAVTSQTVQGNDTDGHNKDGTMTLTPVLLQVTHGTVTQTPVQMYETRWYNDPHTNTNCT